MRTTLVTLAACVLVGCGREEIHAYRAPKPVHAQDHIPTRLGTWVLPENWKVDPQASSMVAAAYDATNGEGGARITVTMLTNDGGGLLANINRWRGQLDLPAVESAAQQPMKELGSGAILVDLVSANGANGMTVAVFNTPSQTWFFKMIGSPKGLAAEHADFERMVREVGLGERPQ